MKQMQFSFIKRLKKMAKEGILLISTIAILSLISVVLTHWPTKRAEAISFAIAFIAIYVIANIIHRKSGKELNPNYALSYVLSLFMVVFAVIIWSFVFNITHISLLAFGIMMAWGSIGWLGLHRMSRIA